MRVINLCGFAGGAAIGLYWGLYQYDHRYFKGDIFSVPDQVARFEQDYLHYQDIATRALGGRQPEPWQVYMLHNQGVTGGSALLSAPPQALAAQTIADAVERVDGEHSPAARAKYLRSAIAKIGANMPVGARHGVAVDQITADQFRSFIKDNIVAS